MKKFIELTENRGGKVYINVDHIGDIYRYTIRSYHNNIQDVEVTKVGVTTHNNGGFSVLETPQEILNLINN